MHRPRKDTRGFQKIRFRRPLTTASCPALSHDLGLASGLQLGPGCGYGGLSYKENACMSAVFGIRLPESSRYSREFESMALGSTATCAVYGYVPLMPVDTLQKIKLIQRDPLVL